MTTSSEKAKTIALFIPVKTKSSSHSAPARRSLGEGAFFNLRVLLGLFIGLAGIFLSQLGFGPATAGSAQSRKSFEALASAANKNQLAPSDSVQQEWVALYNGPGNLDDVAHAIATDRSGNVYVGGRSAGSGT